MPLRPGWGTTGREVMLRANFFALRLPKKMQIYDYKVAISPKARLSGPYKARIFELLESSPEIAPHMGYIAHDRSERLVSARELPQPLELSLSYYEEGENGPRDGAQVYTITIELGSQLNTSDILPYVYAVSQSPRSLITSTGIWTGRIVNTMSCLWCPLSTSSSRSTRSAPEGSVSVKANISFRPQSAFPIALGLEARRGFFMSIRPSFRTLMVNVNVSMAAFYVEGNLAQAMHAFREQTGGLPNEFFDRLRVVSTHLGYPKKRAIRRIMRTSARETKFKCDEFGGGQISVEDFFRRSKCRTNSDGVRH